MVINLSYGGTGPAFYVSGIHENCLAGDTIRVGDLIMAVGEEDVSKLKGVYVSMLLKSKSKATRNIAVVRDATFC